MAIGVGIGIPFNRGGGGGAAPNPDFVSTWDTTKSGSASDTIVLPLIATGVYSGTIDWGDTSTSVLSYANRTHTYASGGVYTITISGTIRGFSFNNGGDKRKILDISNWGSVAFIGTSDHFRGCSSLDISAVDAPDLSGAAYMQNFFYQCISLTTADFSRWDTSAATNMSGIFGYCTIFNGNISTWDVSNVTTFSGAFTNAAAFNSDIGSWNTGSVTNVITMFYGATLFNQNIGSWDLSGVTSFQNAFRLARAFNNGGSSSINNWNVSNVTTFLDSFRDADSFNQPIGNWNMSAVTIIQNMFYKASQSLPFSQDISAWDINQVTNFVNFGTGFMGLSTANYDALLIAWDAQGAMSFSGTVNFGGSKYTSGGAAEAARTSLISKWGGITDGGAA